VLTPSPVEAPPVSRRFRDSFQGWRSARDERDGDEDPRWLDPWACVGAPWLDLLAMLPSVKMQGGPDPDPLLSGHPAADGADPHAITSALAALAGFFVWQAHLPPPPGAPHRPRLPVSAQDAAALAWLRHRTGWE
jgi:hypothetical protein